MMPIESTELSFFLLQRTLSWSIVFTQNFTSGCGLARDIILELGVYVRGGAGGGRWEGREMCVRDGVRVYMHPWYICIWTPDEVGDETNVWWVTNFCVTHLITGLENRKI